ncbi:MAG: hypothetical protein WA324_14385 [Bryobacteraceae bacterium]
MTEVDPKANSSQVELALTNQTDREINALSFQVQAIHNGQLTTLAILSEELVFSYTVKKYAGPISSKYIVTGPIEPGGTMYLQSGFSEPPSALMFTVNALIFGDNTALGDPNFIRQTFEARKAAAQELHSWIPTLENGAADLRKNLFAWDKQIVVKTPQSAEDSGRESIQIMLKNSFSQHEYMDDEGQRAFYNNSLPYYTDLDAVFQAHSSQKETQ